MSLVPQRVDFQRTWNSLEERIDKIVRLHNVEGMSMFTYFRDFSYFLVCALARALLVRTM
jgi:hypothetical protein